MEVEADAVVVVDLQQAFVRGAEAIPDAAHVLAAAEDLVRRARAAGALVVHLQNDGPAGAPDEPESEGWALALPPDDHEPVLRKKEDDGFIGTRLEQLLAAPEIETVVVCGVMSEMCVAATARGALQRGLTVILPRDAHGTYPIPGDATGGMPVPAEQVARVAEWSLGDEVIIPRSGEEITFRAPTLP